MKLATARIDGTATVVAEVPGRNTVVLLDSVYDAAGLGNPPHTLKELLQRGEGEINAVEHAVAAVGPQFGIPPENIVFLPPIPDPGKVLGVAMNNVRLNNTAHVEPAGPMFFLKPPSSLIGHEAPIEIYADYGFTFPELEVGVIIGRRAKHVSETDALHYVAGYTIVNDITSQGLKVGDSIAVDVPAGRAHPDYFSWRRVSGPEDLAVYFTYHARSKGADTFGPMGPWLVTRDEISDPDNLTVRGYADGELFAEDSTAGYSYTIAKIVSWASRYFTLDVGDVITCGTAAKGVPAFPKAHHDIDMSRTTPVIDIEIDGLGRLSNPVVRCERP